MGYKYASDALVQRRFRRNLKSKWKKLARRVSLSRRYLHVKHLLGNGHSYLEVLAQLLPKNLKYQLWCENSPIHWTKLDRTRLTNGGVFEVPSVFSLIDKPGQSYQFIYEVVSALIYQKAEEIVIDYRKCQYAGLEAQVYFDSIIKDVIIFYKRCKPYKQYKPQVKSIRGTNAVFEDVRKMLFSVGSHAVHSNSSIQYPDIVPYRLCTHDASSKDHRTIMRKDIDTTALVDYVIKSLERVNKRLTGEKLEDLCIVISEILINAEEHSSMKYRYSIGYFTEINNNGQHYGVFRLVIMNFGQTIYERFKDPECPNEHSITKMRELSEVYTRDRMFSPRQFEEETLWTLYSLQEGITSTDPSVYKKRGNGSIRFIDSFLSLKGDWDDRVSKMVLMSGNARIVFDGKYQIVSKEYDGDTFQYMTFNESGNIMNKPDQKFVSFAQDYFPGTLISAEILLNENDFESGNHEC